MNLNIKTFARYGRHFTVGKSTAKQMRDDHPEDIETENEHGY